MTKLKSNFSFFFLIFLQPSLIQNTTQKTRRLAKSLRLYTQFIDPSPSWFQKQPSLCTALESPSHTAPLHDLCSSIHPPWVCSLCLCIGNHLASQPFIILSFLHEEMNMLQRQSLPIRVLLTHSSSDLKTKLTCRSDGTYSQGTSPTSMRSPSLSS